MNSGKHVEEAPKVEQGTSTFSVVFEISPSYRYKKTIIRSMDNGKFENRMEINVQYVVRMFEFYTLTS